MNKDRNSIYFSYTLNTKIVLAQQLVTEVVGHFYTLSTTKRL